MLLSLASILAELPRKHPYRIAVIECNTRLAYTQLWQQARRVAVALAAAGVTQ